MISPRSFFQKAGCPSTGGRGGEKHTVKILLKKLLPVKTPSLLKPYSPLKGGETVLYMFVIKNSHLEHPELNIGY